MSQFSTNEQTSLEKRINLQSNILRTKLQAINEIYEVEKCVKFIQDNKYNKVCLQFPDHLLTDSGEVVHRLEQQINRKVYVLGDTAYESCCIDFTAAKHINADCIIHFGPVCFSKPQNIIPFLNIYEKYHFDTEVLSKIVIVPRSHHFIIIIDTPYLHKKQQIQQIFPDCRVFSVETVETIPDLTKCQVLYLGENNRKLMNIYLQHKPEILYYFEPNKSENIEDYNQDTKIIKRRNFLAEKIKDSQTIGIVLSTLAVENYLQILDRTIELIKENEKKYYVISVGKPNVAKLANFPEIDVFVVIACSMNEIYENRDYFKPIVTVFDLECALNSNDSNCKALNFSYDFNDLIGREIDVDSERCDVSLLSGKIRINNQKFEVNALEEQDNSLMLRTEGQVVPQGAHGAGFLASRSWHGLQQDLGKTDVKLAEKGRKGIPLSYDNETQ